MSPAESRRAQRHHERVAAKRRRLLLIVGGFVVLAVVAGIVFWATSGSDEEEKKAQLLVLNEYSITGSLILPPGPVKFAVANIGKIPHNVGIRGGPITADLMPGQASGLEVTDLQPGTYELYCDIADHEERGMVAELILTPAVTPTT